MALHPFIDRNLFIVVRIQSVKGQIVTYGQRPIAPRRVVHVCNTDTQYACSMRLWVIDQRKLSPPFFTHSARLMRPVNSLLHDYNMPICKTM